MRPGLQGSGVRRALPIAVSLTLLIATGILLFLYALPRLLPDQTIARIPLPSVVARAWKVNLERGGNITTGRQRLMRMGKSARVAVKSLLESRLPIVRAEAYSLLGDIAAPEDGVAIAKGLSDDSWRVRRGAILGLGHLAAAEHFRALDRAFLRESKSELRVLIVLAAGRCGGVVHAAMNDTAWSVRRAYVEVLANIERATFLQREAILFQDPDPRVRRSVAFESFKAGSSQIHAEVLADPYHQVRELATAAPGARADRTNWENSRLRDLVVVTLADGGVGSLRWAVEQPGPRRVRFAVHGRIALRDFLVVREPYLVIDGTDAPHDGVELLGYPLVLRGTHHVAIRGIAISGIGSAGDIDPEYADALSVNAGILPWYAPYYDGEVAVTANIAVERCSLLEAIDENIEIYQEGVQVPIENILVRGNFIAFGRHESIHPKGDHSRGLLMGQNLLNVRVEENVFLNNGGRNPFASLAGAADAAIVRNIVRGWTEQGIGIEALPTTSRTGTVHIEGNLLVVDADRQLPFDFQGDVCVNGKRAVDAGGCVHGAIEVRLLSNLVVRAEALGRLPDEYRRTIAEAGWPAGAASHWFGEIRQSR